MFKLLPGFYMGWGLGANDAANVFGPQTHSGIISYKKAIIFTSVFVLLGALLEGEKGFAQVGGITLAANSTEIFVATLSAAVMIHIMSIMKLPASTSHAIVGSLVGSGLVFGNEIDYSRVMNSVASWVVTPIGAALIAIGLYLILKHILSAFIKNVATYNLVISSLSIIIGSYGAYALGANNLANVVGPFVGADMMSPLAGKLIGGGSIAIGVMTYSKNVMETVGKGIVALDPYSALVSILSASLVLHFFSQIGIPVSSSQAMVGAVVGVGILKGMKTVSTGKVIKIFAGWILTLGGAMLFSALLAYLSRLF